MLKNALEKLRDARRRDLDDLMALLAIPSVSADSARAGDCLAAAELIAGWLGALGFEAAIDRGPGRPAVVAARREDPALPTLLVYGHYDVQPPEPLELWHSEPFRPQVRDGRIYARGASDDKGQLMAWIMAARALLSAAGRLPVNLKFLIEGEEETGSNTLGDFLAANAERLRCDLAAISDTSFFNPQTPAITYGLRGITCCEIQLTGPGRDLHSGLYGGIAPNPLHAMAALLATLHTPGGEIAVTGIYDDVQPVSPAELAEWSALDLTAEDLAAEMQCVALPSWARDDYLLRNWARPSLDVNGLWGGYSGEGVKTVIPSWARAKLSMRLAAGQSRQRAAGLLREHLQRHAPAGFTLKITDLGGEDPWQMPADSPVLLKAKAAVSAAFEKPCVLIRGGASVPVTVQIRRVLGCDPVMMGFGLASDNIHSPNENYPLDHFHRGSEAALRFLTSLA